MCKLLKINKAPRVECRPKKGCTWRYIDELHYFDRNIQRINCIVCSWLYNLAGKKTQHHNKLSFRPHLTTWTHKDTDKGAYAIELMNNGLGPALIESFTIKVDGKIISGEQTEPIEKGLKILFPNLAYTSHQEFMSKGYSMAAKEKRTIVVIQFSEPGSISKETVEHAFNRANLIIKYKSFYEEVFTYPLEDDKFNKGIN